jgi:hypothetical protein
MFRALYLGAVVWMILGGVFGFLLTRAAVSVAL